VTGSVNKVGPDGRTTKEKKGDGGESSAVSGLKVMTDCTGRQLIVMMMMVEKELMNDGGVGGGGMIHSAVLLKVVVGK